MGNGGLSPHSACPSGKTVFHACSRTREFSRCRQRMSKMSESDYNTSTFLIKWVTVKPGVCRAAPLGEYQAGAKASITCNLCSVCPRVFSMMNMPGTPPRGNVWEVSWPHAHMIWAGFFGSERAEGPTSAISGWLNSLLFLYSKHEPSHPAEECWSFVSADLLF